MKLTALILLANAAMIGAACSADASIVRFVEVHPDTVFVVDTVIDTIIQIDTVEVKVIDTLFVFDTICGCK